MLHVGDMNFLVHLRQALWAHVEEQLSGAARLLAQEIPIALMPALSRQELWKCRLGMSLTAATVSVSPGCPWFHF